MLRFFYKLCKTELLLLCLMNCLLTQKIRNWYSIPNWTVIFLNKVDWITFWNSSKSYKNFTISVLISVQKLKNYFYSYLFMDDRKRHNLLKQSAKFFCVHLLVLIFYSILPNLVQDLLIISVHHFTIYVINLSHHCTYITYILYHYNFNMLIFLLLNGLHQVLLV